MLKAVIMDFDGLIIDTEVVWYKIYKKWFKEKKHYDLSVVDFLTCVGSSYKDLFNKLEKEYDIYVDVDQFAKDTHQIFIEESKKLPLKVGVKEFIQNVKKGGMKLALATSSKRQKPLDHLKRLGLLSYFDIIITSEDVERIKPYPDLFLKAINELEVSKEEALIVEDSLNGLNAGINAGINVLIIPNDVTKYCDFKNYYKKGNSLLEIDINNLIEDFNFKTSISV